MKLLIFSFLVLSHLSFAEEECAPNATLSNFANKISKGCSQNKDEEELTEVLATPEEAETLCSNCKPLIQDDNGNLVSPSDRKMETDYKKAFSKALLNEIRKNIAGHLKSLMALRTSTLEFDPASAISDCNLSSLGSHTCGGKKGPTLNELLKETLGTEDSIGKIQAEIGNEIYNIANNSTEKPALFHRENSNSCGMTDNQFFQAKMKFWENSFNLDIVIKIKDHIANNQLNIDDKTDIASKMKSIIGRSHSAAFTQALNHPLIAEIFRNKTNLEKYFSNLKLTGDKVKDQGEILDQIYKSELSKSYAANISKSCKQTLSKIKETICSNDFKSGNISFSQPEYLEIATESMPLSSANKEANLSLYCHGINKKRSKPLSLSSINNVTSEGLDDKFKKAHFSKISKKDFEGTVSIPKEDMCSVMEESPCTKSNEICNSIEFIKNSKIANSPESKLLDKRNSNVDKILSAFVGTKPAVTKDAEKYLIAQGIIPGPDGQIAQPTEDQKPQSPSSFAASQKQFASQNPKYSYNPPANGGTTPTTQPGQNGAPGFNSQKSTGSKIGQHDFAEENPTQFQNDGLADTKNGILNRLGKQFGPRPKVAKDLPEFSEKTKSSSSRMARNRGGHSVGGSVPQSAPVIDNSFIPEEEKSKLTEGPKKKDELNEAKQMMGNNRQPAGDTGGATGGMTGSSSNPSGTPVVSVASNGDNVITLDSVSKDTEASELVKQLKERINAEQLQVILESDKKIKVLVNGKEIILTPTPTGYLADCKEASLKKYLEAITAFFSEQLKGIARVDDLKKVFK